MNELLKIKNYCEMFNKARLTAKEVKAFNKAYFKQYEAENYD